MATPASGRSSVRDLAGWNGLAWGASPDQAEAAIDKAGLAIVERTRGIPGNLIWVLDSVEVHGFRATPHVAFDPDLFSISLLFPEGDATTSTFELIQRSLTAELGVHPTDSDTPMPAVHKHYRAKAAVWSFPRCTVTLSFSGRTDRPGNSLMLVYLDPRRPDAAQGSPKR